ncbi:MAG TPA: hypothetical protein PKC23_12265 [Candidatus Desulfobacillus sp.]|nr:hypothetical protein [Candidatus Desulfobacillus sp.]
MTKNRRVLPLILAVFMALALSACGIEEVIKRNDDRYARPGALDLPLTQIYETYQYKFLDKYRVTHQWLNTSNCDYAKLERPGVGGKRSYFYDVLDIYEENGIAWQRGNGNKKFTLKRYVTSDFYVGKTYVDVTGRLARHPDAETGYRPICFESWWGPSHAIDLYLYKMSLATFEERYSQRYPEGRWSDKVRNGRQWRVQETGRDRLRPRRGVDGPYLLWVTNVADTGYVIAIEMTASQDSLANPRFFDALEAVFYHLVDSVKVEPLRQ